ncbi:PH domain-containing protein [Thermogemmatispora sp.]|uniref:PH domain-containing protein n=1 Tax=Thermogemmatispora sp. TaxID=1968838 RepID=UPI001D9BE511|nr:PH domain-containing protein [Thermogemmatispora sp.]MBX5449977.1 PH domain-containing protein [Thermogemmatispora sp.]
MSKKDAKTIAAEEQEKDDPWRSGRARWNIRQFRWGRDKRWHFPGQQPDEVVRLVVRKHKIFLLRPAMPTIGLVLALLLVIWASTRQPALGGLWLALEVIITLLALAAFGWFLWKDFLAWWLETYIITNKRIISSRGVLQPVRQQIEINKVNQVGIDQDSLVSLLLSYGNVHLYLTGGDFIMKDVPAPRRVKDAIEGLTAEVKANKQPEEKPLAPRDQDLTRVLEQLAKGKEIPKLQDADERYPLRHPDRVRGPRRTFGGPLRIPCDVQYSSGEFTVEYIQRSRYVLYRNLALPLFFFVGMPLLAIRISQLLPATWYLVALIEVVLLLIMGLIYINYVDDVYILTNRRIIDIQRRLIFLYEARVETEYKNIRDVKVTVSSVIERLLDIGNVYIETPGSSADIVLATVDHPFLIQDKIYSIKGYKDRVDAISKENASKKELQTWFATVLATLEGKWLNYGTPNLQRLDYWSAVERASEFGLRVVAVGEDASYPDLPPGLVVRQNPPPGTVISQGGEIQVYLSRRP